MKKNYRLKNCYLYLGDCLDVMPRLTATVDMVMTDPPYGTTACKWDSVISLDAMWFCLNALIKVNGAIVLCGAEPFSSFLRVSNIKQYKYDWIWSKSRALGFTNAKNKPLNKHEFILVFSEGTVANKSSRRMPYNPQGIIEINKVVSGIKACDADGAKGGHKFARKSHKQKHIQTHTNYPSQIIEFANEPKPQHPTQKPVALMEYLIKTYTNEGDTVLDFAMGSGTTGVACVKLNRKFIGIELDPKYFQIAYDRIKNTERVK